MCGIAGILRISPPGTSHEPIQDVLLDALDAGIAHRGPDGHGRFRDRVTREDGTVVEIAFVHRRLSIIDHETGAQPMVHACEPDESDLVAVVFNGCIYNHVELREELIERGHRFRSDHSDTEVLVHGYRQWGREHVYERHAGEPELFGPDWLSSHIRGMYALAIWDRREALLTLARDRWGKKPLYVSRPRAGVLVFASAVTPIREAMRSPMYEGAVRHRACSAESLADWVTFGFADPDTPDSLIKQVPSGGYELASRALADESSESPKHRIFATVLFIIALGITYAIAMVGFLLVLVVTTTIAVLFLTVPALPRLAFRAVAGQTTLSGAVDELENRLRHAVESRLIADVPLGCFLSGGIDSSLITLYARLARSDMLSLCVRMPDARYDESKYAEEVADRLGTRHITIEVSPHPATDLETLIRQIGLPFADSSLLPTYWLSRAAREHIEVALSGDGGDELFCGYERYRAAKWLSAGRWIAPLFPKPFLSRRDPKSVSDKLGRAIDAARRGGYLDLLAIFPTEERKKLLGRAAGPMCRERIGPGVARARAFDLQHYLPSDLLRKVDTASMAVALEVRCPFLDHRVSDFALAQPIRRLMPRGELKGILKMLALRYLPLHLVDRPKQGFSIPIGEWFRTDYGGMRTLLFERLNRAHPFGRVHETLEVNMEYVRQMLDDHTNQTRDHSQRLYALLVLSIWSDSLED